MKNIWIINHYSGKVGGRHPHLAKYLVEKGYQVTIFRASTRHISGEQFVTVRGAILEEWFQGVRYIYVKTRTYGASGLRRIGNILEFTFRMLLIHHRSVEAPPDIIVASSVHPLAWLAGYRQARRYGVPLVVETRDLWPETFVSMGTLRRKSLLARAMYAYERFFYTRGDSLIFTVPGGADYLQERGIRASSVHYVNNGVDLEEFSKQREQFPAKLPQRAGPPVFRVVYAGSMGRANHLMSLLLAAEVLKTSGDNHIQFFLFGDGQERKHLEETAKEKGLDAVHFMGRVGKSAIPGILSAGDLNIFTGMRIPLYRFGLSLNKLFEYLASGRPVVSNVPCGYDLLEEYQVGVTVKEEEPAALADAIRDFSEMDEKERAKYQQRAKALAVQFDFKVLAGRYEEILRETLEEHQRKTKGS